MSSPLSSSSASPRTPSPVTDDSQGTPPLKRWCPPPTPRTQAVTSFQPLLGEVRFLAGREVQVIKLLGKGGFGTAYKVQDVSDQTFHTWKIANRFNPETVAVELESYARMKAAEFPVAIHYNLEPFVNRVDLEASFSSQKQRLMDLATNEIKGGNHFREYLNLPHWETEFADWQNSKILASVKKMFLWAYKTQTPLDLIKPNIGLTEEGKVLYFDLYPLDDEAEEEGRFSILVNRCLETFAPEGSELYQYLDPRL